MIVSRSQTNQLYTTGILKGGALLEDTRTLLTHWDEKSTLRQNVERFRRDNTLGKASRCRVEDILQVLRHRFLDSAPDLNALIALVSGGLATESLHPILFFYAARADRLLYDSVTRFLAQRRRSGMVDIRVPELEAWIRGSIGQQHPPTKWSATTITRCAQSVLSALRDFGVLQGAVQKRIAASCLPIRAFAYIAMLLHRAQPSGDRLLGHPDWRLFFLSRDAVERLLIESHQDRLLEYHAAGSVIRIAFPARTIEEYAHVIASRAF